MSNEKGRPEFVQPTDHAEIKLAQSEKFNARLGRMFAALSASNEAILRAKSRQELFQWVCDAAVHGSKFSNCTVVVTESDNWVKSIATTGITGGVLATLPISIDPALPEGNGNIGRAYRTLKPSITNDFQHDEHMRPWHEAGRKAGWNSGGAFPIICNGVCAGAICFNSFERDVFDEETIVLLQRVAENLAFALENFERQERLRESEERFRSMTELSSDWYWEQDTEFRFTRLEGQAIIRGELMEAADYMGKTRWELGFEPEGGWEPHRALLDKRLPYKHLVMHRTLADGTRSYISVSGQPRFDGEGNFIGYRGVGRDITPQKQAEDRIQYLATHDALTGLANRLMFSELLSRAIHASRRYKRSFALMYIDLDHFKEINDTLGHEAGDRLLCEIASRLTQELRSSDVVARLGGDEFVVLVQEVLSLEQVTAVANKVLAAAVKPVRLGSEERQVSASIGVCLFPDDADDEQTLMKNADSAMYRAKQLGKNNFQLYSALGGRS